MNKKKTMILFFAGITSCCISYQLITASEEIGTDSFQSVEEAFEAITYAALNNNFEKIKQIYFSLTPEHQAEVMRRTQTESGDNVLQTVSIENQNTPEILNILVFFLEQGANPNQKNRHGNTPLHTAAGFGNVPIVTTLIDHGAQVNEKNFESQTPLDIALLEGEKDIAKVLIESGGKRGVEL